MDQIGIGVGFDHNRFPDKPFIGSENSHSLEAWKAITDNPWISGQFLWTGMDYLGEAEIWLNDRCLGTFEKEPAMDAIVLTATYAPGTLKALGTAPDKTEISHTLVTTGAACSISLHCFEDSSRSDAEPVLYQVEAIMQDTWGNPVLNLLCLCVIEAGKFHEILSL